MTNQIAKLKDVAKFINGKAFKPTDWSETGLPIIRIQNLNNSERDFNYWSGALDKQVLVEKNNLLFAWSGTPGTSFGAHIWNGERAVLNQHIFRVDLNNTLITKNYAKLVINAKLNKLIEQAHGGVGLQHVTKGMVENLEIPLPPLLEQKRIAAILDKGIEIKAKRELALAKLYELEQNLFVELIKNSNKFGKEKLKKYLLKVNNCNPIKTYEHQEIAYIDIGCIDNKLKKIINPKILDSANSPSRARQVLIKGDILVSTVRPNLNAVAQVEKDYLNLIGSTGFCVLRCGKNISDSFLFSVVKSKDFVKEMNKLATGASYPAVSDSIIMDYEVPVPPMEVQNDYAKKINSIKKIASHFTSQIEKMDKNLDSLQNQAFTTGFNA